MMQSLIPLGGLLLAAEGDSPAIEVLFQHLVAALVFSVIGIAIFALGLWIVPRVLPFSLRKELEEDQNTAVAIIVGSMVIGISLIIAAAIQG